MPGLQQAERLQKMLLLSHIRRYFLEAIQKRKEKITLILSVQVFLYCNKLFEYERSYVKKGSLTGSIRVYNRRQDRNLSLRLLWRGYDKARRLQTGSRNCQSP